MRDNPDRLLRGAIDSTSRFCEWRRHGCCESVPKWAAWLDSTLAICTCNRASSLARTLEGLRRLVVPTGLKWELLVIDNGSLDTTREVLESVRSQLPIRRVFEPRLGLSHARNRALENARGELILWTDDDVIVDPLWLVEHVEGARNFPSAAFFGGSIVPRFVTAPPRWLHRNLKEFGGVFAARALGPGQRWIRDRSELPYGANFSVRRAALGSLAFAPELGRSSQGMLLGEETHLLTTLLEQGANGAWLGDAIVEHMVAPERMNRDYIWSYFYAAGRSEVRSSKLSGVPSASLPWLEAKHAKMARRLRWSFVRGPRWAASFRRTAKLAGAIAELRG